MYLGGLRCAHNAVPSALTSAAVWISLERRRVMMVDENGVLTWTPPVQELHRILCTVYPTWVAAKVLLAKCGIRAHEVETTQQGEALWFDVLNLAANRTGGLRRIVLNALQDEKASKYHATLRELLKLLPDPDPDPVPVPTPGRRWSLLNLVVMLGLAELLLICAVTYGQGCHDHKPTAVVDNHRISLSRTEVYCACPPWKGPSVVFDNQPAPRQFGLWLWDKFRDDFAQGARPKVELRCGNVTYIATVQLPQTKPNPLVLKR